MEKKKKTISKLVKRIIAGIEKTDKFYLSMDFVDSCKVVIMVQVLRK